MQSVRAPVDVVCGWDGSSEKGGAATASRQQSERRWVLCERDGVLTVCVVLGMEFSCVELLVREEIKREGKLRRHTHSLSLSDLCTNPFTCGRKSTKVLPDAAIADARAAGVRRAGAPRHAHTTAGRLDVFATTRSIRPASGLHHARVLAAHQLRTCLALSLDDLPTTLVSCRRCRVSRGTSRS